MTRSLAWRSIRARKGRALLNGLGIVLGVALFFAVLSLSKTIVSTFDELFSSVYGETNLVITAGANGQGTLEETLLGKVRATDGVEVAVPTVSSTIAHVKNAQATPGQKDQVFVAGVSPSEPDLSGATTVAGTGDVVPGQLQLDSGWAEDNDLQVGDSARFATAAGVKKFKISGIVRLGSGVKFGGQGFGATDIKTARRVFDIPRGYSEIDVKVATDRDVATVRKSIEQAMPKGVEVNTPNDIADEINSQIQGFSVLLYFFAAMSLFVGGFLILNSFNMTVAQRLREIGMLRTLGASRTLVRRMIMIEALLLGVIGSLVGLALGLLLTKLMVAMVSNVGFPIGAVRFPPAGFIIAPLLGIFATMLGALRPAVRASRVPPIQAVLVEHRATQLRHGRRLITGVVLTVLGLLGVFTLASSSDTPPLVIAAGVLGVIFLFSGVILLGPVIVPWLVRLLAWPLTKARPVEGRVSADNARSNPNRTASTASGLMIGVALVAAIGSIGSSYIGTISDGLDKALKTDFTVQPRGAQGGPQPTLAESALGQVRALPATGAATGVKTTYLTDGIAKNMLLFAVDPKLQPRFTAPEFTPGSAAEPYAALARGQLFVPESFAKQKQLVVGDVLELEGPRGLEKLRIAALTKGESIEATSLVASLATLERLFGIQGYTNILAVAKDAGRRAVLGRQLDALLADQYPMFQSLSNAEVKAQVKQQMNQVFAIFYVIMLVAILVSLLGVINTLLMSVLERTREIGLIRAIGASRRQTRAMITAESLLITTAGSILGLVVGMALGWAFVRGISAGQGDVSFHPPVAVIFIVALLSVLAGAMAAIVPARRAARLNVIEALSYE